MTVEELPDFTIERLVTAVTFVVTAGAEVTGVGCSVEVMLAVFEIGPPSLGDVTLILIVEGVGPAAMLTRVQLTTVETGPPNGTVAHDHAASVPVNVMFVTPAGNVSVTTKDVAVLGPAFVTRIV